MEEGEEWKETGKGLCVVWLEEGLRGTGGVEGVGEGKGWKKERGGRGKGKEGFKGTGEKWGRIWVEGDRGRGSGRGRGKGWWKGTGKGVGDRGGRGWG